MHKIKRYGWKRGLPKYGVPRFEAPMTAGPLPKYVDLTSQMPPVYDQGELGSCTANAAAALAQFLNMREGYKPYTPSRLAIYYWERVIERTVHEDAGASLTSAAHVLATNGAPNETLWPYKIDKFAVAPPESVVANGKQHIVTKPLKVKQNMDDIRACLAAGYPIMFGFVVYDSFESEEVGKTGLLSMPRDGEQLLGGHAVVAVGYDDTTKLIKVRNSWGPKWGWKGHFKMPYSYVQDPDLTDDLWTAHYITGFKG
jgi:C1A family cysteine protease